MQINTWDKQEVDHAERVWGGNTPDYISDMFDFAISSAKSWLDLGCGFGRFLKYLDDRVEDPDYIGYDSSPDMLTRIKENFPHYSPRVFLHNVTDPIVNDQESIICCAVLIHLNSVDQEKILNNIKKSNPKLITFDINSPAEKGMKWDAYFERQIRGSKNPFRMTWQSHYAMTRKVLQMFNNYKLTVKYYQLSGGRKRVVYFLEK